MGYLTVISEKGMFHSACLLEYNKIKEWYGFGGKNRDTLARIFALVGGQEGCILDDDRTTWIKLFVKYEIPDSTLEKVAKKLKNKYENARYRMLSLGGRTRNDPKKNIFDCVDLVIDAIEWSDLKVSSSTNFFPDTVVHNLARENPHFVDSKL